MRTFSSVSSWWMTTSVKCSLWSKPEGETWISETKLTECVIKSLPKCVAFLVQSVDGIKHQLVAADGPIFATDALKRQKISVDQSTAEQGTNPTKFPLLLPASLIAPPGIFQRLQESSAWALWRNDIANEGVNDGKGGGRAATRMKQETTSVLLGLTLVHQIHLVHSTMHPRKMPSLVNSWHCLFEPQTMR